MTLSNTTNEVSYTAAGSTGEAFTIPFPFFADSEIVLLEAGVVQTQGTVYTITGAGDPNGGTATYDAALNPTAAATMTIYRIVTLEQDADFRETGRSAQKAMEDALDRQVMIDQQSMQQNTTDGTTFDAPTKKVVNVVDPTANQDAATKAYVDSQVITAGSLPAPSNPADDDKGLRASGGTATWDTLEEVPVPVAADLAKPLVANTAASAGYAFEETPPFGGRAVNLLHNGDFRVAQNGTAFTAASVPLNSNDTVQLDRWRLLSEDAADQVDVSQETTIVPDGAFGSIKLEATATGANDKFAILQILEARDTARIVKGGNGKVSLSLEAYTPTANPLRNLRVGVIGWTGTADAPNTEPFSSWGAEGANPVLNATSWDDVGTLGFLNTPADLLLVVDTWTTFTETDISMDASVENLAIVIWLDDADAASGDIVYISNVQLVVGERVGEYGARPVEQELALCQRYLQVIDVAAAGDPLGTGFAEDADDSHFVVPFPVQMRIPPPAVVVGSAVGDFHIANRAATTVATVITYEDATKKAARILVTGTGSALNAGDGCILQAVNANAKLTFDAEMTA